MVAAWILLALSGAGSMLVSLWVLLSGVAFVIAAALFLRPALTWMARRSPDGEPVKELYICAIRVSDILAQIEGEVLKQWEGGEEGLEARGSDAGILRCKALGVRPGVGGVGRLENGGGVGEVEEGEEGEVCGDGDEGLIADGVNVAMVEDVGNEEVAEVGAGDGDRDELAGHEALDDGAKEIEAGEELGVAETGLLGGESLEGGRVTGADGGGGEVGEGPTEKEGDEVVVLLLGGGLEEFRDRVSHNKIDFITLRGFFFFSRSQDEWM